MKNRKFVLIAAVAAAVVVLAVVFLVSGKPAPSPVEDFDYNIEFDYVVIRGYNGNDNVVVIPDEIEGYPVVFIQSQAFSRCNIREIYLPKYLKAIGSEAFSCCISLQTVHFPKSLTDISNMAFYSCSKLQEVELEEGLENIREAAFKGCRSLKKVKLPDSLEYLGPLAFGECKKLDELVIPRNCNLGSWSSYWSTMYDSLDTLSPPVTAPTVMVVLKDSVLDKALSEKQLKQDVEASGGTVCEVEIR